MSVAQGNSRQRNPVETREPEGVLDGLADQETKKGGADPEGGQNLAAVTAGAENEQNDQ